MQNWTKAKHKKKNWNINHFYFKINSFDVFMKINFLLEIK